MRTLTLCSNNPTTPKLVRATIHIKTAVPIPVVLCPITRSEKAAVKAATKMTPCRARIMYLSIMRTSLSVACRSVPQLSACYTGTHSGAAPNQNRLATSRSRMRRCLGAYRFRARCLASNSAHDVPLCAHLAQTAAFKATSFVCSTWLSTDKDERGTVSVGGCSIQLCARTATHW